MSNQMFLYNTSTESNIHPYQPCSSPSSSNQYTYEEKTLNVPIPENDYRGNNFYDSHCYDNKDWLVTVTPLDKQPFYDTHPFNSYFESSEASVSLSSSLGMRTPDTDLFDTASTSFTLPHRHSFEYISLSQSPVLSSFDLESCGPENLIHPFSSIDYMNNHFISNNQITPLQELYPEPTHASQLAAPNQQDLFRLSKEQLIERVVQLEMEKPRKSVNSPSKVSLVGKPIKREEGSNQMYSCKWVSCDIQAPTLEKLMTHICNSHVGSGKATYCCEWQDCSRNHKPFMKRHKIHNHMRTHTGERPFMCHVLGCSKTFSRLDSLSTHIKTHSENRPYLCSMAGCEKAYYHSRSLRKHVKSSHMKNSNTFNSQTQSILYSHHLQNTTFMKTHQSPEESI